MTPAYTAWNHGRTLSQNLEQSCAAFGRRGDAIKWFVLSESRQFVTGFFNKGRTAPCSHKHLHSLSAPRLIYENMAVLRLWHPVADIWPRRPGLNSRPIHVGLVKDKVAVGKIFVQKLRFSPVSLNPSMFHMHSLVYHTSLQT